MSRKQRRWLVAALLLTSLLVFVALAEARPGGGHSYSGGSRSSSRGGGSSGGGGDGGVLFELLIYLVIQNPSVGIPLVILIVVGLAVRALIQRGMKSWSTSNVKVEAVQTTEREGSRARRDIQRLRQADPEFSVVLFEDFVYMLYAAVQRARAFGPGPLAAYLAPNLAASIVDQRLADVQGVIIGALRYERFSALAGAGAEVELELEANYVELMRTGEQRRYYVVDRVVLTRAHTAKSRPFSRASKLDCPNCGAPLEAMRGSECSYCRQDVGLGRFDWMIVGLSTLTREPRGPLLTGDVAESGTERPTIVEPGAPARFHELQQRDPSLSWQAFTARIAHIFAELQVAWAGRDPLRIRPYVSDNLFQSMMYWIDLYLQQRCRNVTEGARILRIDLASVTTDKYYDAVTVRLFATSVDYTISDEGKLLSGSRSRARQYSEYWTLIRGTQRRGGSRGDLACPNCGAPLCIGMAGTCEYCRVKVTAGEFDWVLSRIEQDEGF